MVKVIKTNDMSKCKTCNTDPYFTLETIVDKDNKEYHFDLYSDGTLMKHVYLNGHTCSGSRIGQFKYCPSCGREF